MTQQYIFFHIHPREMKIHMHKKTCIGMFLNSFVIAKTGNNTNVCQETVIHLWDRILFNNKSMTY